MNPSTGSPKEPSQLVLFLTLPYRLAVSSWLEHLLKRPSPNAFTRAFTKEFEWFLLKRNLTLVENGIFENIGQLLLNAKVATMRSQRVALKFTYLVDSFEVAVRPASYLTQWQSVAHTLPDLFAATPTELNPPLLTWYDIIKRMDDHWPALEAALNPAVASELT